MESDKDIKWSDAKIDRLKDIFLRNLEYKRTVLNDRSPHCKEEYEDNKRYWSINVIIEPPVLDKLSLTCDYDWKKDRAINEGLYSWLVRKVREQIIEEHDLTRCHFFPRFDIEFISGNFILKDATHPFRKEWNIRCGYCDEKLEYCMCQVEKDFL